MKDQRAILDIRGLAVHAFYRAGGESVQAGVQEFITYYLGKLLKTFEPIQIIAVLEGAYGNARRRAVYPSYKDKDEQDADNPEIVEMKKRTVESIQRVLVNLGCILVKCNYCEADDTIAYLTERLSKTEDISIYTVDNDLLQLLDKASIHITDRTTGSILEKTEYKGMDFREEEEEHRAPVEMVRLYKSIVGDSSDGYGGAKGIGKETWVKFVQTYGYDGLIQLDSIVARNAFQELEVITEGQPLLKKLYDARESWRVSYFLARLHPEWCELSYNEKVVRPAWAKRVPSVEGLTRALHAAGLEEHAIVDIVADLASHLSQQFLLDQETIEATPEADLDAMVVAMKASPVVGFDWESFDSLKHEPYQLAKKSGSYIDVISQQLTGASFCYGPNLQYSFYLPTNHRDTSNVDAGMVVGLLKELEKTPIVAHNASFEMAVAKTNFDYEFPNDNLPDDTIIMVSHVDENGESRALKKLSKKWLNYEQINYSEVVPAGCDMRDISGQEVLKYGADDSVVCAHMWVLFRTIMVCEETYDFYRENEPFFDKALLVPYLKGIPIDFARLAELEREDDDLFVKTDADLRMMLEEHCSNINELGFKQLWPEVREFMKATMKSDNNKSRKGIQNKRGTIKKEKTEEEIEAKLAETRAEMYERSAYRGYGPPTVVFTKQTFSNAAKSVGLPPMRSLARVKIEDYVQGLQLQDAEMAEKQKVESVFTEDQRHFLQLLSQAAVTLQTEIKAGTPMTEEVQTLFGYVCAIYESNYDLWVGDELNVGSSLQMAQLFYAKMGLPIKVRNIVTDEEGVRSQFDLEGAPSTNEIAIRTWLAEMEEDDWRYKVLKDIMTIRGIRTRRQLYYKPYPLWASPVDGKIHPSLRNCGTITRRPSGSSPNVLQVSKVKDDGKMRGCFLPLTEAILAELKPDGSILYHETLEPQLIVSIDFKQQELAILAALSRDPALLSCYVGNNLKDVHSMTACAIMNMERVRKGKAQYTYEEYQGFRKDENHPLHKLAELTRKKYAKVTNFLIVYGGSAAGLSRKVIVPRELAELFIEGFDSTYPKVRLFQENTVKYARKHGFVKLPFGTRKHCEGIFEKSNAKRSGWERQAINAPIQGGAAEILKITLREYVKRRVAEITGATMYAPVYDEIVASVPISKIPEYIRMMTEIMSQRIPGSNVVLAADISIGPNWGEQIELNELHPSEEKINKVINNILEKQRVREIQSA